MTAIKVEMPFDDELLFVVKEERVAELQQVTRVHVGQLEPLLVNLVVVTAEKQADIESFVPGCSQCAGVWAALSGHMLLVPIGHCGNPLAAIRAGCRVACGSVWSPCRGTDGCVTGYLACAVTDASGQLALIQFVVAKFLVGVLIDSPLNGQVVVAVAVVGFGVAIHG